MTRDVYIHSSVLSIGWEERHFSLSEWVFDIAYQAVEQSSIKISDVDSVVIAAHDLVDGRGLSSMLTAAAAGGYLRDEIRIADDAASALLLADARVRSGSADNVIVVGWGRASEGHQDEIGRLLFDPLYTRPLGMSELAVSGARAQQVLAREGASEALAAAVKSRSVSAARNPRGLGQGGWIPDQTAHPLQAEHLPLYADVRVGMIVSKDASDIKIAGIGQSSEPYSLGERDLVGLPALTQATQRALAEAETTVDDIGHWELDGMTIFDEALACEAVGVAQRGSGLECLATNDHVNASGGSAAGYCWPAMGLVRTAECLSQMRGTAGTNQVARSQRALATGASIVAGQVQTAIALEQV